LADALAISDSFFASSALNFALSDALIALSASLLTPELAPWIFQHPFLISLSALLFLL